MIETAVLRHTNEIKTLKRTTAKVGRIAANLQFIYGELPDPSTVTSRLIYDVGRDILFRNAGVEWRGTSEHIINERVDNGAIYIANITNCNIRILKIMSRKEITKITINNETEITPDLIDLFVFDEEWIELKIHELKDGDFVTIMYTEVG